MLKSPNFICLIIIKQQLWSNTSIVQKTISVFSTILQGLHAFTASQEILEYNSSLGCHLGHYFPLFKTLETRHRTNAVVLIGEELVITVPCQKVVSYF